MKKLKLLFLGFVLCGLLASAEGAVPHLISYQGRLTDATGNPLTGSQNITFRIYDAEAAGNLLWQETQNGIVVDKGLFSVFLGSVTALNIAFDKQYYLEIKVGEEVMSPRQRITSAGYAIRAEKADTATQADNSTTIGNIGVNTVATANKILPLNANAQIPQSVVALKIYDSGWFAISVNGNYDKTHNLGTIKVLVTMWFSTSADGSNARVWNNEADVNYGCYLRNLTTASCRITTGNTLVYSGPSDNNYMFDQQTSGYLRLIMLALE